ncbi:MAG: ATP-dependent Clp protease proteolytic subunit [Candidatus Altiarchaeota archaeon]|nr:ATP-dependent Clp protease proteolytic subunit [Candidatus Altiarchaeota archaeon]
MEFDVFSWIWVLFILFLAIPIVKRKVLESSRSMMIRRLERKRNSRVITMIHRQEALSILGIPFTKFINIEDSEQILRAIRLTPDDVSIDLILHTPGGLALAATQIANAIKKHPAEVRVLIPHYAMSGGTLIALAADKLVMDDNAVLGPTDPILGQLTKQYPAVSILRAAEIKDKKKLDDETLILMDIAEKAINQVQKLVYNLLRDKLSKEDAEKVSRELTEGKWTHDYPLTVEDLRSMKLPVEIGLPNDIYRLMELYPQPTRFTPSVEYIPTPYKKEPKVA